MPNASCPTPFGYRYLTGIDPYSCGVVANAGMEIVHLTLRQPRPWRDGFALIERHLREANLARTGLCAVELRSPKPFTMEGFIEFNRGYRDLLDQWGLLVDGFNPVARTNVAPVKGAPAAPALAGFSFVRPNPTPHRPTFVVAGAGELREAILESERIVRRGETTPDALLEKAGYVLDVMTERLAGLGVGWGDATTVNVYTAHPIDGRMQALLLDRLGPAAARGWCHVVSRPPVVDIEFEMDVRGVDLNAQI